MATPYRQFWPHTDGVSLAAFLRGKGIEVPKHYIYEHSLHWTSFWIEWKDRQGKRHTAHYTANHGQPLLVVDEVPVPITRAEAVDAGIGYECDYITQPTQEGG